MLGVTNKEHYGMLWSIKKCFCFSLQTSLISVVEQELPVSLKLKNLSFVEKGRFLSEQKDNLQKNHC